jgi:alkyl sulfatase BDS1-like metallo-beta-lactamase superfamily hydrolase
MSPVRDIRKHRTVWARDVQSQMDMGLTGTGNLPMLRITRNTSYRLTNPFAGALVASVCTVSMAWADDTVAELELTPTESALDRFVAEQVAQPKIVAIGDCIDVATGYDMANVAVIRTRDGNVMVDTGSCTPCAMQIKAALGEKVSGKVAAIVYTHGDIEQTGGAGVWADADTAIWGSKLLKDQFLRQFIVLQQSELRKGIRQFGLFLSNEERVPSALGQLPEMAHIGGLPEIRLPNHTVDEQETIEVGGLEFQLIASPGATLDHLAVWIPEHRALFVGDNLMRGFPELGSLRGNPHRPADAWITSLDRMRALKPTALITARHLPICGEEEVQRALTDYRDAIQWVRDSVVRGIELGTSIEMLVADTTLPEHLRTSPYLAEVTATVESAVRAVFHEYAGWFDERAECFAQLPPDETAQREVELMGGVDAVFAAAENAREQGQVRWAAHLLAKLDRSRLAQTSSSQVTADAVRDALAGAYETLARDMEDSNSQGYLVSAAAELRNAPPVLDPWPCPADDTLRQIPLETFFDVMQLRLKTEQTIHKHETLVVMITDEERQFVLTIRHGVLEVVEGPPLPNTPAPNAVVSTDGLTWRKLCMGVSNPLVELVARRVQVKGNKDVVRRFAAQFTVPDDFEAPKQAMARKLANGGGN